MWLVALKIFEPLPVVEYFPCGLFILKAIVAAIRGTSSHHDHNENNFF